MLIRMGEAGHEMIGSIAVYSNINRLLECLKSKMPQIRFQAVIPGSTNALIELQKSHVMICDYDLLAPVMYQLPITKWVQGTWAGANLIIEQYDPKKPPLPYTITRFTGDYFGSMMSEYVVAMVVNHERNVSAIIDNQRERVWYKDTQFQLKINDHRGIVDLTFGILGMGAIGREIAKVLKSLKGKTWGMVRSMPEEKSQFVDEYVLYQDLPRLLQTCDYVINVLPSTPDTVGLLNGELLKHCMGKKTVFVNIGRGTVIKESDLVTALEEKWISAAILDVFEVEPLPKSSKLWTLPQVMITPHISGVTKAEYVADLFADNYKRYQAGLPLLHVLDLQRGY